MEKKRCCSFCQTPIEKGFVCENCKKETRKEINKRSQKKYRAKLKATSEALLRENETLRKKIEELKNAN